MSIFRKNQEKAVGQAPRDPEHALVFPGEIYTVPASSYG